MNPATARLLGTALTLLALVLPALVAALGIDAPAGPGERERLARALGDGTGARSALADGFHRWLQPAGVTPATGRLEDARMGAVFVLACHSSLLYLLVGLTRGRLSAVLACISLAVLAPVAAAGARLRPELPAAALGLAAMLPLLAMPRLRGAAHGSPGRTLVAIALSATLIALAGATLPRARVHLLVPAALFVLALAVHGQRLPRMFARGRVPWRAFVARIWPWALLLAVASAATFCAMRWLVTGDPGALPPSPSEHGLLPAGWFGVLLLGTAVAIGGLRYVLGIGLRLGRARRITPSVVLFAYVAALLMQHALAPPGIDALLAAAPAAMLAADGAFLVLVVGVSLAVQPRQG